MAASILMGTLVLGPNAMPIPLETEPRLLG